MTENERLTELEIRLAYQEDILNALDQVVSHQTEQIDRLERINRELYARLADVLDGQKKTFTAEDNQPPPHY